MGGAAQVADGPRHTVVLARAAAALYFATVTLRLFDPSVTADAVGFEDLLRSLSSATVIGRSLLDVGVTTTVVILFLHLHPVVRDVAPWAARMGTLCVVSSAGLSLAVYVGQLAVVPSALDACQIDCTDAEVARLSTWMLPWPGSLAAAAEVVAAMTLGLGAIVLAAGVRARTDPWAQIALPLGAAGSVDLISGVGVWAGLEFFAFAWFLSAPLWLWTLSSRAWRRPPAAARSQSARDFEK